MSRRAAIASSPAEPFAPVARRAKLAPRAAKRVRRQARGDAHAERILAVALDLFARNHVASVTTKEIAAASHVNSAMLYYYFKNKDDLFRQTVDRAVGQVLERLETLQKQASNPAEIISGWLQIHLQNFDLIRKFVKVTVDYASSGSRTRQMDAAIDRFYDTEHRVLCEVLRAGVSSARFAAVDVEQTATFISTVLDGIVIRSLAVRGFDFAAAVRQLQDFLSLRLAAHPER